MKTPRFFHLQLGLQQGLIHTGQHNVCNTVAAIYKRDPLTLVIRPEYHRLEGQIITLFTDEVTEARTALVSIKYGDGFGVDTWDKKLYPSKE